MKIIIIIILILFLFYLNNKNIKKIITEKFGNDEINPCNGLTDSSPASTVPVACLQKVWKDSGCNTFGTVYPKDGYSGWWLDNNGARTFGGIKADMKAWATLQDEGHVTGCVGPKTSVLDTINNKYKIDLKPVNNLLNKVQTLQDGTNNNNGITMKGPINIDMNIGHPDETRYDGQIYRADGQMQIAVDDLLRIRDRNNKETGVEFDTRPGVTPQGPNKSLRLSRKGIQFGDTNNGREVNSAQISAGTHDADALCIVGMGNTWDKRKIHMWSEGGTNHEGSIVLNGPLYFDNDKKNSIYESNGLHITGEGGGGFFTASNNNWTIGWDQNGTVDVREKLTLENGSYDILALLDDLRDNYITRDRYIDIYYRGDDGSSARLGQDGGGYGSVMRDYARGEPLKVMP